MPEIIKAPAGTFCWVESTSKDASAAKRFYGSIFDWSFDDTPMPGGQPYSRAMIGTRTVCGFMQMDVPSAFWLSYIAVDDIDASALKVGQLGGTVKKGPADLGPGRFAIVDDPAGNTFALWQNKVPMGGWLYGENNALCWNELSTPDPSRVQKFYTGLFGWRAETMTMPHGPYTLFKSGPIQIGGMMKVSGSPGGWGVYFQVQKVDDAVERAKKNGVSVVAPATDTEGVGRWSILKDAQSAVFGVLQRATVRR